MMGKFRIIACFFWKISCRNTIIKINDSDNKDKISIIYFFVSQLSLRPTVRLKINFSGEDSISW